MARRARRRGRAWKRRAAAIAMSRPAVMGDRFLPAMSRPPIMADHRACRARLAGPVAGDVLVGVRRGDQALTRRVTREAVRR
jgi:hypothetical protein